ncbi:hypothetical protein [Microbulbifer thermotolerans]|nr:hypothetical protein [Microbulbifer thermotolerans]MCX2779017.1 hypothetical protein [Microbulbifer thermotolerans]MCX2795711.1 hypothetical protein [Microbulbifer thermotolerans]MCX2804685.1 hypothetical protein [Microbulbifer thermotolerans]
MELLLLPVAKNLPIDAQAAAAATLAAPRFGRTETLPNAVFITDFKIVEGFVLHSL